MRISASGLHSGRGQIVTVSKCTDKCVRILFINDCLQKGQVINVENLANNFNVSCRSVHRDIDTLRIYYADRVCWGGEYQSIIYDRLSNGYRLT